jgi:hypothetical protein
MDFAVTLSGVAGVLGFIVAARVDDANALTYDVFAFVWLFIFGGLKLCLPRLSSERTLARRHPGRWEF